MIGNSWDIYLKDEFQKPYFKELLNYVKEEYKKKTCFPPQNEIFNAFRYTKYEDLKVVILGQDPYHGDNQAEGLSFSVKNSVSRPPSLQNIFKELESDLNIKVSDNNSLVPWAEEGVLLLNAVLTVERKKPASHQSIGWETFTDEVIIESPHPSPFSAYNGFFGSKPFSRTNNFLISKNIKPINWQI